MNLFYVYQKDLYMIMGEKNRSVFKLEGEKWVPVQIEMPCEGAERLPEEEAGKWFDKAVEHMKEQVRKAQELAKEKHDGQFDKAGVPYFAGHISTVAAAARELGGMSAQVVGYLHDTLEDTDTTEEDLRKLFDDDLVDAVVMLTKGEEEVYLDYVRKIKANRLAKTVKICDLSNNLDPTRMKGIKDPKKAARANKYRTAFAELMKG